MAQKIGIKSKKPDESFGERESFGEEVGNTITHGVMAAITLLMTPFAAIRAYSNGKEFAAIDAVGVSVFCICIFTMFITSAAYHSTLHKTKHKLIYNKLDHIAIFLAIAGTYTPIALSVVGGTEGIILVSIQWLMVLAGILVKTLLWQKTRLLSVPIYLVMGWAVVFFFQIFKENATPLLFWMVAIGGVCYSLGCIFYAVNFKFSHMIFHFFINAGATCHFIGIVFALR
ncbi:MAG: PAQR family membrane homeostasis protein TrhA [Saccharofermentanales bacterium]